MTSALSFQTKPLHFIEDLQQPVKGYDIDIEQFEAGAFQGSLIHGAADDVLVSFGRFNRGVRSRGIWSGDKVVLGLLVGCSQRATQRSVDASPGSLVCCPAGHEHDSTYRGHSSFAGLAFDARSAPSLLGSYGERLADADLRDFVHVRPPQELGDRVTARLARIVPRLAAATLSEAGARYWSRAIVEAFAALLTTGLRSPERDRPIPSARIVRQVEDLVGPNLSQLHHISDICRALNVSRRTLHRAFDDVVGIGPVTYLRHKRLNAARRALQTAAPPGQTVTRIALDHGFDDVGRFCAYYQNMFGEYPLNTLKKRH